MQFSLSLFFIGQHTGSKFIGTDKNGPNSRIKPVGGGRAQLQKLVVSGNACANDFIKIV